MKTSSQVDKFTILPNDLEGLSLRHIRLWWTSSLSLFFAVLSWLCVGPIPPEIINLTNLQELILSHNMLTGQNFSNFIQSYLKRYIFSSNVIWGTSSPAHFPLICLAFVCIGPIPPEIVKLTNLRQICLDRNHLKGRSIHSHFCPMILTAYLYVKKDRGEPVHQLLFVVVLFCLDFV